MGQKTLKAGNDLTSGALLPKIILFTLPLMATGILQLLFNTADTVVVGRWGGDTQQEREAALAAVGSCGALINLIINLFFGLAVGAGVCVAQEVGAKRYEDVKKTVHTSVLTAVLCGLAVSVIGFVLARPLLTLMGTEPAVLDEAVPYMRAYFIGAPANTVYNYSASMLRSTGDTTRPLIFLSIAGAVNVGLNMVMVIVFELGALGVGIATAASQWISGILVITYMMKSKGYCHLDLKELKIHTDKLKRIISIGIPAGLQGVVFSISNALIQSSVNSFGQATVAANTAASNLDGYLYQAEHALYDTTLTFVGQNVGARNYKRLKKSILYCVASVVVLGVSLGILMVAFDEQLLGIFAPGNEQVVTIGKTRLKVVATTYFLCGIMEIGSAISRGFGKSFQSMIISLLGSCLTRIVWIFTIFAMTENLPATEHLAVLYACYPMSWFLTFVAHFIFGFILINKSEKAFKAETGLKTIEEGAE